MIAFVRCLIAVACLVLPALAWAQTTRPAAIAGTSAPTSAPTSANDLFAALAAPDRDQRLDHLRAIKAMLADGGDARAVAAARARLEALLASETSAAADQPPAIVMSALAARIDAAIARLEKSAGPPGADDTDPLISSSTAWGLLCGLTLAQAVALTLALFGLRRSLSGTARVPAMLARLDELTPRIGAVLARTTAEPAPHDAARDLLERLQDCTEAAAAVLRDTAERSAIGLARTEALVSQSERVATALPALMGEAVSSLEARGLPALDAVAQRLTQTLAQLTQGSADQQETLREAQAASAQLGALGQELRAALTDAAAAGQARAAGTEALETAIAAISRQGEQGQQILGDLAAMLEQAEARVMAAIEAQAASPAHAVLPEAVARLSAQLAPIELAARESAALMESIDARVSASLSAVPQAASALARAVQALRADAAEERLALTDALESQRSVLASTLEQLSRQLGGSCARLEAGQADHAAAQLRRHEMLTQAVQRQGQVMSDMLQCLSVRADAALSALAPEASVLSATAAQLSAQAALSHEAAGAAQAQVQLAAVQIASEAKAAIDRQAVAAEQLRDNVAAGLNRQDAMLAQWRAELAQHATLPAALPSSLARLDMLPELLSARLSERLGELLADGVATIRAPLGELRQTISAAQMVPAGVVAALGGLAEAMARVAAKAEAHDVTLHQVMRATQSVQLALQAPAPGQVRLEDVTRVCDLLAASCESLAEAALRGDRACVPEELPTRLPGLLEGIDRSIHRLRGCATALALAGDLRAA